jgi:hypothetical protein
MLTTTAAESEHLMATMGGALCRDFVELWRWLLVDKHGGGPDALLPLAESSFAARVLVAGPMASALWRGLLSGALCEGLLAPAVAEVALLDALRSVSHTDSCTAELARVIVDVARDLAACQPVSPSGGGASGDASGIGGIGGGGSSRGGSGSGRGPPLCRLLIVARRRLAESPASHDDNKRVAQCEGALRSLGRVLLQPA